MNLKTVLLVTDGSDESAKGDDMAITLASLAGAQVVVMCSYVGPSGVRRRASALRDKLRQEIETEVAEILQEVAERITAAGLTVRAMAVEGSPVATVHQVVESVKPDLVVLGTCHTSGLPGLLWGSIAEIVRTVTVPVLIAK